jgi:asparagine synthetase B (glutamine-hydrolysing)
MCSFLFTDVDVNDFDYTNHYMRFRGPDATNSIQVNEYTIAHNILSITGEFTPQPFVDHDDEIVCVYNGQIYNYDDFGDFGSDGECIIPTYKKFGERAFVTLDGELLIPSQPNHYGMVLKLVVLL